MKDSPDQSTHQRLSLIRIVVVLAFLALNGVAGCGTPSMNSSPDKKVAPTGQTGTGPAAMQNFRAQGVSFSGPYMVNELVGWYVKSGGEPLASQEFLWRTVDGGKSWKAIILPAELLGKDIWVTAFDDQMVFLQPFQPAGAGTAYLYFYRTIDAGKTWQRCNWPTIQPKATDTSIGTTGWTFLDHMHGWAVTPLPDPSMVHVGGGAPFDGTGETLFQTSDGGQSWQLLAHLPIKYVGADLTFVDMQTGWLTTYIANHKYPDPNDIKAFNAVLYVTHDGGRTWKQAADLPLPPQENSGPLNINNMFFTQQQGYITVSFFSTSYLYMTQDGGNTWQVDGGALPGNGLYDVIDATHVEDGEIYTLTNGQWKETGHPPMGTDGIYGGTRECLSAQVCLATVHNDNALYESRDGGQNWQKVGSMPSA